MARKKGKPGGDRPKRRRPAAPSGGEIPDLPPRTIIEQTMRQLTRQLGGEAPPADTPLSQAQDLVYQAFEEPDPRRRAKLAREALALSPDCADAYNILAEQAANRKEALKIYQEAVAAGERALGPEMFEQGAGHFWGILETRPYMRARAELANLLWTTGRRDETVRHLQDMLRLNPGDNQGLRYALASHLLFLDLDDDLARLLDQYPDEGSANWAYTRALLAFRRHGDAPESRELLKAARKSNKHVVPYLTGEKYPDEALPPYYSPGQESEALHYVASALAGWKQTPGAVDWLRQQAAKSRKGKKEAPEPQGPLGFVKQWLKDKLLQEEDVWQVGFRPLDSYVSDGGVRSRVWVLPVLSLTRELILGHEVLFDAPPSALVWDTLVKVMRQPATGRPHRPTRLEVHPGEPWESLRSHLDEIGIALDVRDDLEAIDAMVDDLARHLGVESRPGMLDAPGVKPEQVASFYDAAAEFFRRAPWKKVGFESAIKIECDRFKSGPWYAVLMGQSGLVIGLALYEDLKLLRKMWSEGADNETNARRTVATTVMFEEEVDLPAADADAVRRYGWKVARPDAYPSVVHKERGLSMRPPLAWELELVEGSLRAVPEFVTRRDQDDPTPEEFTVPTATGSLRLVLSWIPE